MKQWKLPTALKSMMSLSNKKTATHVLKLKNVHKTYLLGKNQQYHVLKNINLTIDKNEFIAIVGPSGSGKSTLMHLMGLLDVPSQGQVFINNQEANKLSDEQLAKLRNKEIGFVFQQFFLLNYLSALDNVALPLVYAGIPLAERRQRAAKLLARVGLAKHRHHHPNQLSGGQQQRVAIARALINHPSIILADEPTGNLDSKSGEQVLKLFQEVHQQGQTIILVTHDHQVADIAQRKIFIRDGQIIKEEKN